MGTTWKVPPVPTVKLIVVPEIEHPVRHVAVIAGVLGVGGCTTGLVPATVGGKATTTSLNCLVDPPIPESTVCVGS
jgi:hypothetical protein